jgi:mannose-6-phosphate isomerase-like protein (cupin superfamily)
MPSIPAPARFARHARFEGVFLRPVVTEAESTQLASVEALIVPNHVIELHNHQSSDEHFFFIDGTGELYNGSDWLPVSNGDAVTVKAGTTHALRCTGITPLRYLATYCPPLT